MSTSSQFSNVSEFGALDFTPGVGTVTTATQTVATLIPSVKDFIHRGWVIRNLDAANPIYVGKDATVSSTTGFPIKAGEVFTFPTQKPVWLIATGGSVNIAWLAMTN